MGISDPSAFSLQYVPPVDSLPYRCTRPQSVDDWTFMMPQTPMKRITQYIKECEVDGTLDLLIRCALSSSQPDEQLDSKVEP